jgi:hypothetical protein
VNVAKIRLSAAAMLTAISFATIGVGTAHADQVHMFGARNDLQQAVTTLQQAQDDKGGHRVTAINLANQAIDQVNQGIQFAGGGPPGNPWQPPRPWGPPMTAANAYLQFAVNELQAAVDDKGGHRIAAINLTQQAMDQVNQGIQFGGPN